MNAVKLIAKKRDGENLSEDEIRFLIDGFTSGDIPDYQMSAFCMAVYFQGMNAFETVALTRQMLESGLRLQWGETEAPVVDKHSTGGVGDKISIPLAPILACLGLKVPMISGRGLGATGGTLDKLESIPGFRTDLDLDEIRRVTNQVGCVITGASQSIAPADRKLYALRDVTGTVPSIPLITASILSKKLAAGLDALILDVKWGNGAFMKTIERARSLAQTLVSVGTELGVKVCALVTDMNQPLGRMVGNQLEVMESLDILNGRGPDDVRSLTFDLASDLYLMVHPEKQRDEIRAAVGDIVSSGQAMTKFRQMVNAQNGRLEDLPESYESYQIECECSGIVQGIHTEELGWVVIDLGGGRKKVGDSIEPGVGLEILVRIGDQVKKGMPLARVFDNKHVDKSIADRVRQAICIGKEANDPPALIVERIQGN
jgi:pyrimidine-nucleoside phosphorylase